jgi:tellurite resistance protein
MCGLTRRALEKIELERLTSCGRLFGARLVMQALPLEDDARRAEIGLCVLLAAADGDVSEREIGALSSRLGSIVGDDYPAIALAVIVEAEIAQMGELGPERYVGRLVDRLPQARRIPALRGALLVACADGLAPEEERMFRDVALELGIEAAAVDAMLEEVQDKRDSRI